MIGSVLVTGAVAAGRAAWCGRVRQAAPGSRRRGVIGMVLVTGAVAAGRAAWCQSQAG